MRLLLLTLRPAASARQDGFIWTNDTKNTAANQVVFRKTFMVPDVSNGLVRIFADARYILWINGQYVARGPCRFDPAGPEFDTLDVENFLKKGRNVVAVMEFFYMLPRMVQGYIEIDVESATDGSSVRIDLSQRGSATSIAPEKFTRMGTVLATRSSCST